MCTEKVEEIETDETVTVLKTSNLAFYWFIDIKAGNLYNNEDEGNSDFTYFDSMWWKPTDMTLPFLIEQCRMLILLWNILLNISVRKNI